MSNLTERFGTKVFSEDVMKRWLPKDVYKKLAATIEEGEPLDLDVANAVAHAMKEWALLNGATHYAHWFQPLSGITSEKHDSFLEPNHDGTAAFAPPSRPAATPPGTLPAPPSSRTRCCVSPPPSVPTPARLWTRRRPFCAP